jgi:vacuolar-type H+-ATPase subunit C/Vma6
VAAIEDALRREAARLGFELFRSSENGFALLIGFFYLKQEETRQLLSLAQMVRRKMATQEIVAYLER